MDEGFGRLAACPGHPQSISVSARSREWGRAVAGLLPDCSKDKFGLCAFQGLLGKMPLLAALPLGLRPRTSEQIMCHPARAGEDRHVSGEHTLPVCRAPAGRLFLHVLDQVQIPYN